ncbi:MAG: carbonic anhydrase family protein [Betaproteobacteria bacterium]
MQQGLVALARAACCALAALPLLAQAAPAKPHVDLCERGQRQSPIDITATKQQALAPLQFDYRAAPLRIVNDGHTVRVRFANGSRLLIGRESLTLQQFHFHVTGGDRVRGEDFAMAMHFLHKSSAGQLVSLVVLFRLGAENAALAALLPSMPPRGQAERVVPALPVDPAQMLPREHGYYAYDGSLTAPPCTEGVRWIVLKTPLELSAAQVARLKQLFPNNARPVQPLNGRVVSESL